MTTEKLQIYKCEICGNIVEVLHEGSGVLVCCGKPMNLQEENVIDASEEKHVPVVRDNKVFVGSVEHPMVPEHYIEWIEAEFENNEIARVFLKPGQKPQAKFPEGKEIIKVRAYCNLHGLWKKNSYL